MSAATGSVAPATAAASRDASQPARVSWLAQHWPLLVLLALAGAVRLSTLDLQSFWYDEAYTPVHVLHDGLGATLRSVVHTENSPPLWYLLAWVWSHAFGTGVVALRSLSAAAGLGVVALGWPLGMSLAGRRAAIVLTAILAVNPLMVWYSQEARVYELFTLTATLSLLLFVRAWRGPAPRALAWWAAASVLALLTHYFSAFLVAAEAGLLLARLVPGMRPRLAGLRLADRWEPVSRGAVLAAVAAVAAVALAVLPLLVAQGGHHTQWIGRWALSSRLVAIPGYYLLGGQSSVFGHGLLLLCAVPALLALGLLPGLSPSEWRAALLMFSLGVVAILVPLLLALAGADYLAPRNLVAAWVPLSAALAVVLAARGSGRIGLLLAALVCLAGLAVDVAIDLRPRLQRGDWNGVARVLRDGRPDRALVTVQLGSAPLEYYLGGGLHPLARTGAARVSEVDVVGYRPLRAGAGRPPTPAFRVAGRRDVHGLLVYRFLADAPQTLGERVLRARSLTATRSETLVPAGVGTAPAAPPP